MSMKKKHRRALERTLEVLVDDLDLQPAITHLRSRELLAEDHEEIINAQVGQTRKVPEFISILKRRGDEAFDVFRKFLSDRKGQKHLALELDKSLKEIEETCVDEIPDSRQPEKYDEWSFYHEQFYCFPCSEDSLDKYKNLPETLHFLLIGKTGSGKSATGNTILGENVFPESSRTMSKTKTISWTEVTEGGKVVRVVDTPGLFDTAGDFSNRRLSLEIAKALINFKDGIHLFLLVCNPSSKFTREEERTIAHIEAVLKKDIYDFCVLILTHSKGKFGEDGKESLMQFIEEERKCEGKFADLINSVRGRVVAVENSFSEALLRKQHRQKLLSSLAEIVTQNKGQVYRNRLFEVAEEEMNKEYKKRQKRYSKAKSLFQMKKNLEKYLFQMLSSLDEKDLNNLKCYLRENVKDITKKSEIDRLQIIDEADVKRCFTEFVDGNNDIIERYLELKRLQNTITQNDLKRHQEIRKTENRLKMENFTLNLVGNFLRQSTKESLQHMKKELTLPDDQLDKLLKLLKSESVTIEISEVKEYIYDTFFKTPEILQKYIDEKDEDDLIKEITIKEESLSDIQQKRLLQNAEQDVQTKVPSFVRDLSQEDLTKLKIALQNNDEVVINVIADMFAKEHMGYEKDKTPFDMKEIGKFHFMDNSDFILGMIKMLEDERSKLTEFDKKVNYEQKRNETLRIVSDVIDNQLKCYLTDKTEEELKEIYQQLNVGELPEDIFNKITKHVYQNEKQITDETMIRKEILTQLHNKRKIVEELIKESHSCFAGSSLISTIHGTKKLISSLKIGDEILVFATDGKIKYEKVYLLSHANKEEEKVYIRISTKLGKVLLISPGHFLPIGRLNNNVPAKQAAVGETIFSVEGDVIISDVIVSVSYQTCKGAFCPMTMNGTIVVNDVAASCYTTFFNPSLAQNLLWPFRIMFRFLPTSVFHAIVPYDSVQGMPIILSMCRLAIITLRSAKEHLKHASF